MTIISHLINSNFQQKSDKAAFFCAISFMFFIPSSTALMNLFIFLTLIFILLSGNLINKINMVLSNPVTLAALIIYFFLLISTFWAIDNSDSIRILKKYNELWYLALILPLFNSEKRRNIGINAYLISMGIVLTGVYLMFFNIVPIIEYSLWNRVHHFNIDGGFASHILTNILMAFAMFISAQKIFFSKLILKPAYLIFFILSAYYVFFISTGTSGQVLGACLILLFIIQHGRIRSVLIIPGILIFVAAIAIANRPFYNKTVTLIGDNDSFQTLTTKIQERYHHATSTDTAGNNTRPRIYYNALKLIRLEPWIGSGVGSYEASLKKYQPEFHAATVIAKKNPHNEYLMMSAQLGLVGLVLLLNLFYAQAKYSERISNQELKNISQGLVVLIVIGCMGNSMLLDSREGHFWAFFSALLFSSLSRELE